MLEKICMSKILGILLTDVATLLDNFENIVKLYSSPVNPPRNYKTHVNVRPLLAP